VLLQRLGAHQEGFLVHGHPDLLDFSLGIVDDLHEPSQGGDKLRRLHITPLAQKAPDVIEAEFEECAEDGIGLKLLLLDDDAEGGQVRDELAEFGWIPGLGAGQYLLSEEVQDHWAGRVGCFCARAASAKSRQCG
jgi:hypothetical protein